jgi:hypothetical protein
MEEGIWLLWSQWELRVIENSYFQGNSRWLDVKLCFYGVAITICTSYVSALSDQSCVHLLHKQSHFAQVTKYFAVLSHKFMFTVLC